MNKLKVCKNLDCKFVKKAFQLLKIYEIIVLQNIDLQTYGKIGKLGI